MKSSKKLCICVIPARGGSVRLPRKNVRWLAGRPVLWYSLETAFKSELFDHVIVSTDDDEIAKLALDYNPRVEVFRRPEVDRGERGTQAVTYETLDLSSHLERVVFACTLYPIAPLVRPQDLRWAFSMHFYGDKRHVIAVGIDPLRDAGAFYFSQAIHLGGPLVSCWSGLYPMPEEQVCDVDNEEDWQELERKFAKFKGLVHDAAK